MSQAALLDGVAREVRRCYDRERLTTDVGERSRTLQEFVEESDINNILKRYRMTGMLPQKAGQAIYGDFSNLPSYQEALNTVIAAEAAFMELPSDLRTRFDNDPQKFLDFVQDEANKEELYSLGLAVKPVPSDTDRIVDAVKASASVPAPKAP